MPGACPHRVGKDPRPISDPEYRKESTVKVITFLVENGYPHTISPKILKSPSTKDFVSILSFLLAKLDPNFKFVGKFEDEFPQILKYMVDLLTYVFAKDAEAESFDQMDDSNQASPARPPVRPAP